MSRPRSANVRRLRRFAGRWLVVRRHRMVFTGRDTAGRQPMWVHHSHKGGRLAGGHHLLHIEVDRHAEVAFLRLFAHDGVTRRVVHEIPDLAAGQTVSRLVDLPYRTEHLEVHAGANVDRSPIANMAVTRLGRAPLAAVLSVHWWRRKRDIGLGSAARRGWRQATDAYRTTGPTGVVDRLVRSQASAQRQPTPQHPEQAEPVVQDDTRTKMRARHLEDAERTFEQFLDSSQRVSLAHATCPAISVVLVLYNKAELTLACLRSLEEHGGDDLEVIIVDNASSDRTDLLLERIDNATVIRAPHNEGFVNGANRAAALASAPMLAFLNNDAQLLAGTLAAARRALADSTVGVVGGPVVAPWNEILEAGGIVWRDGTTVPYGRHLDADDLLVDFRRDTDYVSGCLLATTTDLWHSLGGFDPVFAPAYYEDVDYCFRARAAGRRTLYDPDVIVVHVEHGSATSREWVDQQIRRNRTTFAARHASVLHDHHDELVADVLRARQVDRGQRRVALIDDRVPYGFHGAGAPRTRAMLDALVALDTEVTLVVTHIPDDLAALARAVPRQVEVAVVLGREQIAPFFTGRSGYYDDVIISRPHNMETFLPALQDRDAVLGHARLIYDAEAISTNRDRSLAMLRGEDPSVFDADVQVELALAAAADLVLAVSPAEAAQFAGTGVPVAVVSHGVANRVGHDDLTRRAGLLFVGNLAHPGSPNNDAVEYFLDAVLPILRDLVDDATLRIAGRIEPDLAARLVEAGCDVLGAVDDLEPVYGSARVCIAPTRFAAGIPLKVIEAASFGVPIVATMLLAEQLAWDHVHELPAAAVDDAAGFAQRCAELLVDDARWHAVREAAAARVEREYALDVFARGFTDALGVTASVLR